MKKGGRRGCIVFKYRFDMDRLYQIQTGSALQLSVYLCPDEDTSFSTTEPYDFVGDITKLRVLRPR
ncbi:hypothetical protein MAR_023232 [Mya arenaria]|uniref:Uncharacterized protein n=1 Tax=Mya arenaria TaxID=6604 RepID=A0ABY7DNC2_MYAAR|nr:hypothetical protein MAR_023232 [Mya arenaria]